MLIEEQDYSAHRQYTATVFYDLQNERGEYLGLVKARTSLTTLMPVEQSEWTVVVANDLSAHKQEYNVSDCQIKFNRDSSKFIYTGTLATLTNNRLM